jgi:hypothetical protein
MGRKRADLVICGNVVLNTLSVRSISTLLRDQICINSLSRWQFLWPRRTILCDSLRFLYAMARYVICNFSNLLFSVKRNQGMLRTVTARGRTPHPRPWSRTRSWGTHVGTMLRTSSRACAGRKESSVAWTLWMTSLSWRDSRCWASRPANHFHLGGHTAHRSFHARASKHANAGEALAAVRVSPCSLYVLEDKDMTACMAACS